MKLLCTILALLVLTLSVQPVCGATTVSGMCCVSDDCTDEQEHSGKGHEDDCSSVCNPFQLCHCCAFCVVVPAPLSVLFFAPAPIPRIRWGVLRGTMIEEPVSGFWQPPRAA